MVYVISHSILVDLNLSFKSEWATYQCLTSKWANWSLMWTFPRLHIYDVTERLIPLGPHNLLSGPMIGSYRFFPDVPPIIALACDWPPWSAGRRGSQWRAPMLPVTYAKNDITSGNRDTYWGFFHSQQYILRGDKSNTAIIPSDERSLFPVRHISCSHQEFTCAKVGGSHASRILYFDVF